MNMSYFLWNRVFSICMSLSSWKLKGMIFFSWSWGQILARQCLFLIQNRMFLSYLCYAWKIKEKGIFFSSCLRSLLSIDLKGLDIFFCLEAKMKSFVTFFFGKIQGYKKIQVGTYSTWKIFQRTFHLNILVAYYFKIY